MAFEALPGGGLREAQGCRGPCGGDGPLPAGKGLLRREGGSCQPWGSGASCSLLCSPLRCSGVGGGRGEGWWAAGGSPLGQRASLGNPSHLGRREGGTYLAAVGA